jgi:hypothetical protein
VRVEPGSESRNAGPVVASDVRPPAIVRLAHRPAIGVWTVLEVREDERGYVIESRRQICRDSAVRVIGRAAAAPLERVLGELSPAELPEPDPCPRNGRDGATWIAAVGSSLRARSFRSGGDESCERFQRAAEALMQLAQLSCRHVGCFRATELHEHVVQCP